MKKIYMAVTRDKFSLPLAVADSRKELAKMRGVAPNTISKEIRRGEKGMCSGYVKVEVGDDDVALP